MKKENRPLILLIFANDRQAYLETITKERQQLIELLRIGIEKNGLDIEVDSLDYTTIDGILKALNLESERLAVLHFAGHSSTDLLQLDEGQAHARGLAAKFGDCPNLKLVFLNGCNNVGLIKAIVEEEVPNVIGTRQPVLDNAALYFSRGFFSSLVAQSSTLAKALNQAKTDVETLTGKHYRSLDIKKPNSTPDWAWFMDSRQPDWKLADITHPCNQLPILPRGELPTKPFKNLYYYTEADAEIFFGRCQEILDTIELLDTAKEPVLLLHGGTGVGKSSFLLAGLIPRIKAPNRQQSVNWIRYNELDPQQSLLKQLFGSTESKVIRTRLDVSPLAKLPAIWIIDQLEDVFFAKEQTRLNELLITLHTIFYSKEETRPKAKLIFSLRTEWFGKIFNICQEHRINTCQYLLKPLNKNSIIEVIEMIGTSYLYKHYCLKINNLPGERLSEKIASDLLTHLVIHKSKNISKIKHITKIVCL